MHAGQDSLADPEQVAQHNYMLVDFALGLLHSSLKKGTLGGQSPAALALLDPMLPLLVRALRSRHANSVSLALKCLAFLIRLPLPGSTLHLSLSSHNLSLTFQAVEMGPWPCMQHQCFLCTYYKDHCCLLPDPCISTRPAADGMWSALHATWYQEVCVVALLSAYMPALVRKLFC